MIIDFLNSGTYKYRSISFSNQKLMNLYSDPIETSSSYTQSCKISVPGSTEAVSFSGTAGIRGLYNPSTGPQPDYNSKLHVAVGNEIYRVNSNLTKKKLGNVGDNYTTVKMADDGFDLCVVDGYSLYVSPLSAEDNQVTWTNITLPYDAGTFNRIKPDNIVYLNGYIVINSKNTNQFFYSNRYDARTWSSLDFQSAEGSADKIVGLATRGGELWVFGPKSFEVFDISNDPYNAFAKIGGTYSEIGCANPDTIAQISDMVFWLGSSSVGNNTVYLAAGLTPQRISNNDLEHIMGKMTSPTDCTGFCYAEEGHLFYILTFNEDNQTWVYDVLTKEWHNRSTRNPITNQFNKWDPQFVAFAYGRTYFGSNGNPKLLNLDINKYSEWDGKQIVREIITPTYINELEEFSIVSLQLDMSVGETTILTGQGSDPKVMLQVSTDGGFTWGNEKWKSIGKTGQYGYRVKWHILGHGRKVTFRFLISDPIPVVISSIKLEVEKDRY